VVSPVNLDQDFCLILADFGRNGAAFLETQPSDATFDRAVTDIIQGQVDRVLAVVQFNPTEDHSRDITEDIAQAVSERVCRAGDHPIPAVCALLDRYGLGYPAAAETAAAPSVRLPPASQLNISTLSEHLQRANDLPKRPAAVSVSSLNRGSKPAWWPKTDTQSE
jgi:hypothetical protein